MARASLPAAILGAGALIGLGLYLGLRGRTPTEPVAPPMPQPVVDPRPAAASPPSTPMGEQGPATVRARAEAALEDIHDTLVEECWAPSARRDAEPASITVGLSLAFDAEGTMRGTGVLERRDANRPDIVQCLTERVHALSIEGIGVPASVEVELQLP